MRNVPVKWRILRLGRPGRSIKAAIELLSPIMLTALAAKPGCANQKKVPSAITDTFLKLT